MSLTAALAACDTELSSMITLRTGHNERNASSPSSPLPSCINSRMLHIAAAICSSPLPFLRHRSILSLNVSFLQHHISLSQSTCNVQHFKVTMLIITQTTASLTSILLTALQPIIYKPCNKS